MKITEVKVIVTCPGRNYVFVRVMTDVPGLYGVGEGTLNGSEPIVAEAIRHMSYLLIGRDPQRSGYRTAALSPDTCRLVALQRNVEEGQSTKSLR